MKQLLLMRHAKSSWSNPDVRDFDRTLNERGHSAADKMATYLSKSYPQPDQINCSTARRTRETLGYLLKAYAHPMNIVLTRKIYEASYGAIMELVHGVSDDVQTLMIVGHNPGMEEMAFSLCGDGDAKAFERLGFKYPTAACAHLSFDVQSWSDLTRGCGFLTDFICPKIISKMG